MVCLPAPYTPHPGDPPPSPYRPPNLLPRWLHIHQPRQRLLHLLHQQRRLEAGHRNVGGGAGLGAGLGLAGGAGPGGKCRGSGGRGRGPCSACRPTPRPRGAPALQRVLDGGHKVGLDVGQGALGGQEGGGEGRVWGGRKGGKRVAGMGSSEAGAGWNRGGGQQGLGADSK